MCVLLPGPGARNFSKEWSIQKKIIYCLDFSQCQLRVGWFQGSQGVVGVCVLLPGGGNLGGESQASIHHTPRWKTSGKCKNTNVGR